jgi:kumamolisin
MHTALSDPLVLAVAAAVLTLIGNMIVAYYNNAATNLQEKQKAGVTLILQAIGTGDPKIAKQNIRFFIEAGLLDDAEQKIAKALEKFSPVLPGAGASGLPKPLEVKEIARLYNFPAELDGSGQTIGILEFGGGYRAEEIASYFASVNLPMPKLTDVAIGESANRPGNRSADAEVAMNIEIIGAIAPNANMRIYFASYDAQGMIDAVNRAVEDGVTVISISWGSPESTWSQADLTSVNKALQIATEKEGITVVAAAGDRGVTSGVKGRKPHVLFPASSPWVLAVGGTSLVSHDDKIVSEIVWNETSGATGGGVSDVFDLPDWQTDAAVPMRKNHTAGRGVPDVAAIAFGPSGAQLLIRGERTVLGGTGLSASVWAGLVALISQGLGRKLGYFNPILYQKVGPAGVLRPITIGNNQFDGVPGYSAGPGWNAVAGWGSPDGRKLLEWLRTTP